MLENCLGVSCNTMTALSFLLQKSYIKNQKQLITLWISFYYDSMIKKSLLAFLRLILCFNINSEL